MLLFNLYFVFYRIFGVILSLCVSVPLCRVFLSALAYAAGAPLLMEGIV